MIGFVYTESQVASFAAGRQGGINHGGLVSWDERRASV